MSMKRTTIVKPNKENQVWVHVNLLEIICFFFSYSCIRAKSSHVYCLSSWDCALSLHLCIYGETKDSQKLLSLPFFSVWFKKPTTHTHTFMCVLYTVAVAGLQGAKMSEDIISLQWTPESCAATSISITDSTSWMFPLQRLAENFPSCWINMST